MHICRDASLPDQVEPTLGSTCHIGDDSAVCPPGRCFCLVLVLVASIWNTEADVSETSLFKVHITGTQPSLLGMRTCSLGFAWANRHPWAFETCGFWIETGPFLSFRSLWMNLFSHWGQRTLGRSSPPSFAAVCAFGFCVLGSLTYGNIPLLLLTGWILAYSAQRF